MVPGAGEPCRFVGRLEERQALLAAVAHARLVTVTGPGGVGKTRLVGEVLARLRGLGERVALVELEAVEDPTLLGDVVAAGLGVSTLRDARAALVAALESDEALLVLDGCEHLGPAVADLVGELLRSCPGLSVLATSQHELGLQGEHVVALEPLPVPGDAEVDPAGILGFASVELLVERARAAGLKPVLDPGALAAAGQVCRLVNGLPLALELVASRAAAVGFAALAAELEAGAIPKGERDHGPVRRRSVEAAIAYSLGLLSAEEREVVEALSVFPAGASASAVAAVLAGRTRTGVAEQLRRLVRKSVVTVRAGPAEARFDLLRLLRSHSLAGLAASGRLDVFQGRFVRWCLDTVAGAAEAIVNGPDQGSLVARLRSEEDNLRGGLEWSLARRDVGMAAALCLELWRFWTFTGRLAEARSWLQRVVGAGEGGALVRAELAVGLGDVAWLQGDLDAAEAVLRDGLALAKRAEPGGACEATILNHLGLVALFRGDPDVASVLFDQALTRFRALDVPARAAIVLSNLGLVKLWQARYDEAPALLGEALALQEAAGDAHGRAITEMHWAMADYFLGDLGCAADRAREAAAAFRSFGDDRGLGYCLAILSATLAEADPERALLLLGGATARLARVGSGFPGVWRDRLTEALVPARRAVGIGEPDLVAQGRAMPLEAVLALAGLPASTAPLPADLGDGQGPVEPDHAKRGAGRVAVEMLGRFALYSDGRPVRLAPQPARLVKLLAAHGRPMHVEEVIEALWPEVAPELGRRRLRNVVSRANKAAGVLVERDGKVLALADGVETDAAGFEAAAKAALEALAAARLGPEVAGALGKARAAAERYRGELLPSDGYEEFAVGPRERLARLRLRLLDVWASVAAGQGARRDAEAALRAGIDADPTDEARYLALAELLIGTGRAGAAAAVLARARAVSEELGLAPSDLLVELERTLRAGAGSPSGSPTAQASPQARGWPR